MADFRIENELCEASSPLGGLLHDARPCRDKLASGRADGRCIWCERELPTQRELEAQADAPIPYRLTEIGDLSDRAQYERLVFGYLAAGDQAGDERETD